MARDNDNDIIDSINIDHVISDVDSEVEDQSINFMTKGRFVMEGISMEIYQ